MAPNGTLRNLYPPLGLFSGGFPRAASPDSLSNVTLNAHIDEEENQAVVFDLENILEDVPDRFHIEITGWVARRAL